MEKKEYNRRMQKHQRELYEKYMTLYQDERSYEKLLSSMEDFFCKRSSELKELDRKREENPTWFRDGNMLGMTMYPKLFAGGLKGLTDRLDYLSEQNITYLHLMPLLKMPHPYNDGGYAVEDFTTVDPEIGTNSELIALTKALRRRKISLCLDLVMNHTADTHEWAMRAKAGETEYIERYQCYDTFDIPSAFEKTMPQVFPTTAPGNFAWCEEMKKYVLTTFYPYQWDLNYRNPKVFHEMLGNILRLANMGVEVFRIDAVPYIWKELGASEKRGYRTECHLGRLKAHGADSSGKSMFWKRSACNHMGYLPDACICDQKDNKGRRAGLSCKLFRRRADGLSAHIAGGVSGCFYGRKTEFAVGMDESISISLVYPVKPFVIVKEGVLWQQSVLSAAG